MTRAVLLACCLPLLACDKGLPDGPNSPGDDPLPEFPEACAAAACTTGAQVADPGTLADRVDATLGWERVGPYTTGCLPASEDVPITGSITLHGDELAPPDCGQDCRTSVRFFIQGEIPGVSCIEADHDVPRAPYHTCAELQLTDTTIRLRRIVLDVHPGEYNFVPMVEVLPACAAPCGPTQLACSATHTCWANARDYCAYCLGGDNDVCSCWEGDGFKVAGTACEVALSGDLYQSGTCQSGVCVPD